MNNRALLGALSFTLLLLCNFPAQATPCIAGNLSTILGACLSSHWSGGRESDSLLAHEQGLSSLEN